MKRHRCFPLPPLAQRHRAFALALFLAAIAWAGASPAAPLEVYGRLPLLEEVAISPDGGKIAFVRTEGESRLIAVVSLADNKLIKVIRVGDVKLRRIAWADDERILVTTSSTGMPWGLVGETREWTLLQVIDLRSKEPIPVPQLNRNHTDEMLMNVLSGDVSVRRIDGHTVLFLPGIYVQRQTLPCLVRYDLETNRQSIVVRGNENSGTWIVGENGEVVADEEEHGENGRWRMRIAREGKLREVASGTDAIDVPQILGYGPSDDTLLTEFTQDGTTVWKLLSLRDGTFSPLAAEGSGLSSPIEDPYSHRMIGGVRVDDDVEFVFFDDRMQKHWEAIVRAYGAAHVRFISSSSDFKKIIVLVEGDGFGYQYQLVDLGTHSTRSIGDVYSGLRDTLPVRRIDYPAADGLSIPAYLTLPPQRDARHLPLVVLPHGGPAAADTMRFDWWSQALAQQGYAVLQPNYRGSTISNAFFEKGFGEFGRKMQTDLSDGVRYLAAQGMVDPARVCIVGASYGGYAALAGVSLDPGVYRCAASVAGISDLRAFLRWVDDRHGSDENFAQRYWDRFLGVRDRKDPRLDEISPIKHVDRIAVPVLLVHGKDDTVVPYDQSDDMYDALRHARKPVEMVKLEDEDHWLSRSATRLQMLQAVVAFLQKNNPPDAITSEKSQQP